MQVNARITVSIVKMLDYAGIQGITNDTIPNY